MNSFRAYFQLNGITAGDVQGGGDSGGLVSISSYVLGFGDDSETTGIIEVEANSSLFTFRLVRPAGPQAPGQTQSEGYLHQ